MPESTPLLSTKQNDYEALVELDRTDYFSLTYVTDDIINSILAFIDLESLGRLTQTNRRFNHLINKITTELKLPITNDGITENITVRGTFHDISEILNLNKHIKARIEQVRPSTELKNLAEGQVKNCDLLNNNFILSLGGCSVASGSVGGAIEGCITKGSVAAAFKSSTWLAGGCIGFISCFVVYSLCSLGLCAVNNVVSCKEKTVRQLDNDLNFINTPQGWFFNNAKKELTKTPVLVPPAVQQEMKP